MFSWFGKVSYVPYSKVQDFAVHLKDGRIMGSRCKACGYATYPPRADCPECMSGDFEFVEISGRGTIYTYSTIEAVPVGFEDIAPYTVVVVEVEEGGRLLGWLGDTLDRDAITIGDPVQVVPRIDDTTPDIKLFLTIEEPGTTWGKAPAPHLG